MFIHFKPQKTTFTIKETLEIKTNFIFAFISMEAYTYTHLIDHGMVYNTMVCEQGTLYISNVVYCRLFEQKLNIYVYLLQKRRMIMDFSQ